MKNINKKIIIMIRVIKMIKIKEKIHLKKKVVQKEHYDLTRLLRSKKIKIPGKLVLKDVKFSSSFIFLFFFLYK